MPTPFAINGFGRIGRALARIAQTRSDLEWVAVNDLAGTDNMARLLARDSVHGPYAGKVESGEGGLWVDGKAVSVFHHDDPASIPWQDTKAKVVVEATGDATARDRAAGHLSADGPSKVIVSAICEDADWTGCRGVRGQPYDAERHHVISNASCTTNCLALLLDVLHREFGVRQALMNEVHSYTGNQTLMDARHADPRRGRAAALNIVPTYTAAPAAVERLIPELQGRLQGLAVRVPTPNVALLDLVAHLQRPTSADEIRQLFRNQAEGPLKGLLGVSDEPLVSSDYVGDGHSAVVDLDLVQCLGSSSELSSSRPSNQSSELSSSSGQTAREPSSEGSMVRVVAWYDNEWGYAQRLADLIAQIGECIP